MVFTLRLWLNMDKEVRRMASILVTREGGLQRLALYILQ
jgi:hypothetical protein